MRPLPATASQEKSHVPSWSLKRYLAPLMWLQKFPDIPVLLEGNIEVPGTTSSEPLLPSWSGQEGRFTCFVWKGYRPSWCTSGWGPSQEEIRDVGLWVVPHAERPWFPGLLLIRTWRLDTSSKATLCMKAKNEGELTPPCIVRIKPQVPHTARQVACYPVNNSRVQRSSITPHKTRPDSPVLTL